MNIIETPDEFNKFIEQYKSNEIIIIPTYSNGTCSTYEDNISLLYVYVLNTDEENLIIFSHTEGLNIDINLIDKLSDFQNNIYIYNKKSFLNFFKSEKLIDLGLVYWWQTNQFPELDFNTTAHEWFTKSLTGYKNLNEIIPITKHIESSKYVCEYYLSYIKSLEIDDAFLKYNNIILNTLHNIEKSGIYIDTTIWKNYYPLMKIPKSNIIYSEYNILTSTGRPSNRFNHVNFAALSNDSGIREAIISRYEEKGMLVSFDYDSYHLRLLGELVGYEFTDESVHMYLGKKYYFKKDKLTEEEYKKSKSITFQLLYGGITKEYQDEPFFQKVHEYTKLIWECYELEGYIETPIFGRKFKKEFFPEKSMYSAKLLNYVLQAFETERNLTVLFKIYNQISSDKVNIILYTYDSLTLDLLGKNGLKQIKEIQQILEENKKYPVKMTVGFNYQNMIEKSLVF